MNRFILRLAYGECAVFLWPVLLILGVYVLLVKEPFRFFDGTLALLACGLGTVLGFRIFWDGGGVRAFLFSRTFSPGRLFLVRWLFGLAIIFGVGIIMAGVFVTGLRQAVQTALFANGWFPTVRFSETQVLGTYVVAGLFSYHTTLLFVIRHRYLGVAKFKGTAFVLRGVVTTLMAILFIIAGIFCVVALGVDMTVQSGYARVAVPVLLLVFGLPTVLQSILVPICGIYCYKNQEVES
ncbi:MAG TPA: hypothetical protein DEB39_08395 [Planctomycetaceae bacterium]|nr:hypothetical protein [Planctomycetaceae bacterium]